MPLDIDQMFRDVAAAAQGDQAAARRLEEVQRQVNEAHEAQTAALGPLVLADSLIAHPCYSRELWEQRYPGHPMPTSAVFDQLGCRLDPVSGYRIPESCNVDAAHREEKNPLCPNNTSGIVYHDLPGARAADFAMFVKTVKPMLMIIAGYVGPVIAASLGPLVSEIAAKIGGAGTSFLTKEISFIGQQFKDAAQKIFSAYHVHVDLHAVRETFGKLGVTAKTLSDAVRSAQIEANKVDPRALVSYEVVREQLSFASNLLQGDVPSIGMLDHVVNGTAMGIVDFKTARLRQDSKKTMATLTGSLDSFAAMRGGINPSTLQTFIQGNMPESVQGLSARGGASFALVGPALQISNNIADKYAGKAEEMIRDFSPEKIASLIGDSTTRAEFLVRAQVAKAFDAAIAPYLKQAEFDFAGQLDEVNGILRDTYPLYGRSDATSRKRLQDMQRTMREKLDRAEHVADLTIQSAVVQFAPYELGAY